MRLIEFECFQNYATPTKHEINSRRAKVSLGPLEFGLAAAFRRRTRREPSPSQQPAKPHAHSSVLLWAQKSPTRSHKSMDLMMIIVVAAAGFSLSSLLLLLRNERQVAVAFVGLGRALVVVSYCCCACRWPPPLVKRRPTISLHLVRSFVRRAESLFV